MEVGLDSERDPYLTGLLSELENEDGNNGLLKLLEPVAVQYIYSRN